VLRWQQDMKESVIAAVLGITEKTVSAHLHQARRKLIAKLGPSYPFPATIREDHRHDERRPPGGQLT
jgi:DNA-binding transcriptional regulator LsrR (DeoR family)